MKPREIEIVGGGLAGLSLAAGLASVGVAVVVHEAGSYPRHRVCGEFIAGLDRGVRERLGLDALLSDAERHRTIQWFHGDRPGRQHSLREPAIGLSRFRLDQRLADRCRSLGVRIICDSRVSKNTLREGCVLASGRRRSGSPWVGLKTHVLGFETMADLELHLAPDCYVGVCRVEGGRTNVCGLFHRRHLVGSESGGALESALARAGLTGLCRRIESATLDPASRASVAGLDFSSAPESDEMALRLGDSVSAIPPFSGHGMALAFASADAAIPSIESWARGRCDWGEVIATTRERFRSISERSLTVARRLHPWLLEPHRQTVATFLQRHGLLPISRITEFLHA